LTEPGLPDAEVETLEHEPAGLDVVKPNASKPGPASAPGGA